MHWLFFSNWAELTSNFSLNSLGGPLILAAVGQLQFEVVQARLKNEYGVDSDLEPIGYTLARWADGGWDAVDKADKDGKLFGIMIVQDIYKRPVLLFRNDWKAASVAEEEKYLELSPWSKPPSIDWVTNVNTLSPIKIEVSFYVYVKISKNQ